MRTTSFLTKRNIFYLNILLAVILVLSVFLIARDIISLSFDRGRKPQARAVSANHEQSQGVKHLVDYREILVNNPFGFPGGEIRALTSSSKAPVQQGDLRLLGTVVGPSEMSYAIVRNRNEEEIFKLGEPVFGSGELYGVKPDKVLIRQGGEIIEIQFQDVAIREMKEPGSNRIAGASFAQRVGRGSYVVDQRKLQQAIENPAQIMTDARLKPNFANGREEGFSLSEVKPGGIYQSLGLRDGDVLLRINEYDISDPQKALQAFTALRGLDRVRVDLIRAGSKMTMTYQIQ